MRLRTPRLPSPHVADPGRTVLRRALRVAVVLTAAFLLLRYGVGSTAATTFGAFSAFALLVFADFGGPLRRRFLAYAVASVVGLGVVAFGQVVSGSLPVAVIAAFGVGFVVSYSAMLRGYVAAAGPALQLGFVIPVTLQQPIAELPQFLLGWAVGSAMATVGAVVLWPVNRRSQLRRQAARACRSLATVVRARWAAAPAGTADRDVVEEGLTELDAAVAGVDQQYAGKPFRPAGATVHERALMQLVDELHRLKTFLHWALRGRADTPAAADPPSTAADAELATDTAALLERAAASLDGRPELPDVAGLAAARSRHRDRTEAWVAGAMGPQTTTAPGAVVDRLAAAYPLRVTSMLSTLVADRVAVSLGGRPMLDGADSLPVPGAAEILRAQLSLRSPWLRNALRAGLGLALAMAVALLSGVQHGFWVVLGTLSVLRFDVLGTGRTAVQAISGTALGFGLGTLGILLVGDHDVALLIALPVTAFAAAYAPAAISFTIGQAGFTLFVIVLFGLMDYPPQLNTGVVRFVDIVLGAAVSLVVGMLLWPRGVAGQLRASMARGLRASDSYLRAAFDGLLGRQPSPDDDVRRTATAAVAQATETFDLALMQRGPGLQHADDWARMATTASHVVTAADLITATRQLGWAPAGVPGAAAALAAGADDVDGLLQEAAAVLAGAAPPDPVDAPDRTALPNRAAPPDQGAVPDGASRTIRSAVVAALRDDTGAGTGDERRRARAVVGAIWARDWLAHLAWLGEHCVARARLLATEDVGEDRRPTPPVPQPAPPAGRSPGA
ncbi:MAG: hypothetical protein EPO13_04945 [Actinomycetota bacterium]|nr:MAG: hypothetical protein EPO13_04945 [Actinomycetota bacterium]